MTNEIHDRNHELLCAYVLGEVNETERAEVEALLAGSEELRAEKERLEKTIGLVQDALGDDDRLSASARESVLSAAVTPAPVRSIWQRPWVRIAAGVMFVSLALGGWAVYERRGALPPAMETAKLDGARADASNRLERKNETLRDGALDVPGRAPESAPLRETAAARPAPQAPPLAAAEAGARERKKVEALLKQQDAAVWRAEGDATTRALYDDEDDSKLALNAPPPGEKKDAFVGYLGAKETPGALRPTTGMPGDGGDEVLEDFTVSTSTPIDRSRATEMTLEEREANAYVARGAAPIDVGKRTFRGPSDSVPAGGATGGPGAAPPPTTPGLSTVDLNGFGATKNESHTTVKGRAAATGAPASSSDDAFVGAGSKSKTGEAAMEQGLRRMQTLGYSGGEIVETDVELSDEDLFILEKLGIAQSNWHEAPRLITPEVRTRYRGEYVDHWCRRILIDCRRRPNERPRDMFFRFWGDNPFELSALDPLSTFSADVDTASYTLARRYLNEGHLPQKAQIRTEEFVNYFKTDVPSPEKGVFAIDTVLAPSRFGNAGPTDATATQRDMLRVVIRGKDVAKAERKPLALTFVVDCSGSMKEQNRMEMVKHAMRLLVSQLDARDSIAIVKFSTDAAMVLPMTSAANKPLIESAIHPLFPDGSTNSEAGLRMGYAAALAGLNVEANNRVVFLSDGVANVGVTDPNVISEGVKTIREQGVYLNVVGVGMNNHNDVLLEQLADKSDGVCNYVDTPAEAKKVFVDDLTGALETIARDVKLQVEFDPAQVARYRLLGYENRAIADADFRNDKVDAGEVGAGHQVTALYEIEYASPNPSAEKPLATVRVRYKAPRNPGAPTANEEASEISHTVNVGTRKAWEGAGPSYRRTVVVAQFAEFLRRSVHARNDSFDQMLADARKLESEAPNAEFSELVTLMEKSKALILGAVPQRDELSLTIDEVRENCVLRAQLEQLARERDRELLADLERSNAELENRLRELLRRRLEQPR